VITDSSYQFEESALTPRLGLISGLAIAMFMLAFVFVLQPISGLSLRELLAQIGAVVPGALALEENLILLLGGLVHGLLGALFGLLYALCQQRVPVRGLIGVGLFYGFLLWVVGGLLIGSFLAETLRAMVRSWPWLLACLLYGLCLAACAIWAEQHRPVQAVVPKD